MTEYAIGLMVGVFCGGGAVLIISIVATMVYDWACARHGRNDQ